MAAIPVPRLTGVRTGLLRKGLRRVATAAAVLASPHKAALPRLADMPLTVIGVACIDFAAFHYVHMIGWLVTGISLVVVEHMIADDEDPGRRA